MAVVSVLSAAWVAVTLPILIAWIPSSKLASFHKLSLQMSGRGKIMDSSARKLSVPHKYFCHFYIVGVVWTTFLLVATWVYAHKTTSHLTTREYKCWTSVFLLILMEAQVVRRLIESIYVFKYSPSARMHIAGYLTGIFFYTAAPLSLCSTYSMEVFKILVIKGKDRMEFDLWGHHVLPLVKLKWYSWIGAAFFFWGWIHQRRCHAILGSLRENGHKAANYAIPEGDWFHYVSSPHYLAEITIYGGLVIASGFSDMMLWLVFAFVVANLAFSAGVTHRWYLHKFDDYPRNRYAIFPFIY